MLFGLFTLKHVPVKFFLVRRSCQLALTCVSFIPSKRYSELPFIPSCSSYFFQNEERLTKNVKKQKMSQCLSEENPCQFARSLVSLTT